jgi:hypothetical protein
MGIDLTICPDHTPSVAAWHLSYTRMGMGRDYELFERIKALRSRELPDDVKFSWYDDEGIVGRRDDPYGEPLRYVFADDLAKVDPGGHPLSRAAIAYVGQLDAESRVVLWWH